MFWQWSFSETKWNVLIWVIDFPLNVCILNSRKLIIGVWMTVQLFVVIDDCSSTKTFTGAVHEIGSCRVFVLRFLIFVMKGLSKKLWCQECPFCIKFRVKYSVRRSFFHIFFPVTNYYDLRDLRGFIFDIDVHFYQAQRTKEPSHCDPYPLIYGH